ncbi:MAG TPA: formylglycine-generating enzyme family protein [Bryobacteraceae bacterium]
MLVCMVAALSMRSTILAFQGPGAANAKAAPAPKLGDAKVNATDGLRYLWIPPGSLTAGCSPGDKDCFEDETPARKITLTRGFWLSQTEVTQAAFQRVMEYNPSVFEGADLPVEMVSWNEADAYCSAIGGRLPSAAEWEYAARAGTSGSRYGNLDDIAWYWGNSKWSTHPVGKKKPNAFGLYDMLGNVVEWTHTFYWVQLNQENINPTGPSSAEYMELRGGGWWDDPELIRASYRRRFEVTDTDYNIGFRCVSN